MIITVLINDEPYYYDTVSDKIVDETGSEVVDETMIGEVKRIARDIVERYGLEDYLDEPVYASTLIDIKTDMDYYLTMARKFAEIYEKKAIPTTIKIIDLFESLTRLMSISVREGVRKRQKKISPLLKIQVVDGKTVPVFECCTPGIRDTYSIEHILEALDDMSRNRKKLKTFLESVAAPAEMAKVEKLYNALEIYAKLR